MNNLHRPIITLYKLHNKLSCESRLSLSFCRAIRARRVEPSGIWAFILFWFSPWIGSIRHLDVRSAFLHVLCASYRVEMSLWMRVLCDTWKSLFFESYFYRLITHTIMRTCKLRDTEAYYACPCFFLTRFSVPF